MTETGSAPQNIRTVAVIGCGLIGASWAALFSAFGHQVRLWDAAPEWKTRAQNAIADALRQLRELGASGNGPLTFSDTLEDAVAGVDWAQENVPEHLDVKRDVFKRICSAASPTSVIASSTSSFTWTQLEELVSQPARLITAHPFNPPHLMPLVEVYAADESIGAMSREFFASLGKQPIMLRRPMTGHVANRLASALWREAVNIVAMGVADVADVDLAMTEGPGLRWSIVGPHMAYHLGGGAGGIRHYLGHLGDSQARRWADLGTPTLTADVKEQLARGVEHEAAGRSIEQIAQARDQMIVDVLKLRRNRSTAA